VVDRAGAVFALEGRVMTDRAGNVLGLVDHPGPDRSRVHLDETHDVGPLGADEIGDTGQDLAVAAQVARARDGKMEGGTGTCGVANVIDEQTHVSVPYRKRRIL